MTDRELLELAAKAVGIVLSNGKMPWVSDDGLARGWRVWNPLTDDGDALRLAVKLGGELRVNVDEKWASFGKLYTDLGMFQYMENDPLAATRRAIVRAAAELGKEMK